MAKNDFMSSLLNVLYEEIDCGFNRSIAKNVWQNISSVSVLACLCASHTHQVKKCERRIAANIAHLHVQQGSLIFDIIYGIDDKICRELARNGLSVAKCVPGLLFRPTVLTPL